QAGLFTADPRKDPAATLVAEHRADDPALEAILAREPQAGDADLVAFPDRLFREIDPFLGEGDPARLRRYEPQPALV
ncbi:MAG TPA: hypothetical protein PLO33_08125, partial [Kouleothrix sp.]|nr:hypothetical protein [Kouleothrix sp.]